MLYVMFNNLSFIRQSCLMNETGIVYVNHINLQHKNADRCIADIGQMCFLSICGKFNKENARGGRCES